MQDIVLIGSAYPFAKTRHFGRQQDEEAMTVGVESAKHRTSRSRGVRRASIALLLLMQMIGLLVSGASAQPARATETEPAQPTSTKFATVWRIRGDVSIEGGPVGSRALRLGDSVFVGETIHTPSTSEAVLRTEDAGVVALRPGTRMSVDQFSAKGQANDAFGLRLLSGSLRVISGWIGRMRPANYRIATSTATIGIRGTDHEPYVVSQELGRALNQRAGTYDKVNRGGTTLEAGGGSVAIAPGQAGFAPELPTLRQRGLFTILLPSLLDAVPDFYVPGSFDAELDVLSKSVHEQAEKVLQQGASSSERNATDDGPQTQSPAASGTERPPSEPDPAQEHSSTQRQTPSGMAPACDASGIARQWLARFDDAVMSRDAAGVAALFADDLAVTAYVRRSDGSFVSVEMNKDMLVKSTLAALESLRNYSQKRLSIEATILTSSTNECHHIGVQSEVIEQGTQSGRPYRIEALEQYVLEFREDRWLAVQAITTQQ